MKTKISISDDLLARVKEHAKREGRSLRDVVEDALRLYFCKAESAAGPRLSIQPWGRGGFLPEYRNKSWNEILGEINERPFRYSE